MLWSVIPPVGTGKLGIVKGNLNKSGYRNIIDRHLLPNFVSGFQIMAAFSCMKKLSATQRKVLKPIWLIKVLECFIGLETGQILIL